MAYITQDTTHASGLFASVAHFFNRAAEQVERRRVFRRTFNELSVLNERELYDLGITHAEINRVAYEASNSVSIKV